jgi:hypothetical protein
MSATPSWCLRNDTLAAGEQVDPADEVVLGERAHKEERM